MLANTITYDTQNYTDTLGSDLLYWYNCIGIIVLYWPCLSTVKHGFQSQCKGHTITILCIYSMIADLHQFLGYYNSLFSRAGGLWKLLHPSYTHSKIEKLYVLSAIELISSLWGYCYIMLLSLTVPGRIN